MVDNNGPFACVQWHIHWCVHTLCKYWGAKIFLEDPKVALKKKRYFEPLQTDRQTDRERERDWEMQGGIRTKDGGSCKYYQ